MELEVLVSGYHHTELVNDFVHSVLRGIWLQTDDTSPFLRANGLLLCSWVSRSSRWYQGFWHQIAGEETVRSLKRPLCYYRVSNMICTE